MDKQEKLAELHSIRTTLEKVAKSYCSTSEERETVKGISLRLYLEHILPLAEELTAELVNNTKKLVESNTTTIIQLVDLGLPSGTLWADRNIGADTPEQAGDYFRFGETTPFTENSPEYFYDDIEENIAGTTKDAATVILGKGYKIPTLNQIEELFRVCKWEWAAMNEVNGMKITGPNGNNIFFPASGCRYFDSGKLGPIGNGYYWSESTFNRNWPDADDNRYACCLSIYLGRYSSEWRWYGENRAYGYSVRAVAKK